MELGKKSQMRGGLYLDICVWVPEFLVTPLLMGPVCLLRARPPLIVTVLAIRAIRTRAPTFATAGAGATAWNSIYQTQSGMRTSQKLFSGVCQKNVGY